MGGGDWSDHDIEKYLGRYAKHWAWYGMIEDKEKIEEKEDVEMDDGLESWAGVKGKDAGKKTKEFLDKWAKGEIDLTKDKDGDVQMGGVSNKQAMSQLAKQFANMEIVTEGVEVPLDMRLFENL